MPELFLELFSEEIPARMQARAAEDLARLVSEALAPLSPADVRTLLRPAPHRAGGAGRRRGGGQSHASSAARARSAPEQALAGFLRKHGATQEQLREEGDFWVLEKATAPASRRRR